MSLLIYSFGDLEIWRFNFELHKSLYDLFIIRPTLPFEFIHRGIFSIKSTFNKI